MGGSLRSLIPALFVLLWATGFIGAKYTLPYAEPYTLLAIRMVCAALILGVIVPLRRQPFPGKKAVLHSMVAGALIHCVYLGSVFTAIEMGMPAGLTSLLVGLQPMATALIVWWLHGVSSSPRVKVGLVLGLVGVAMVLSMRLGLNSTPYSFWAYPIAIAGLAGITVGTIYQKRFCIGIDLVSGMFYQYVSAGLLFLCFSFLFDSQHIQWTPQLLLGLAWMIFGLSFLSIWLLMIMLKRGQSTTVATYFYMVPAVTAAMAWALFGETLTIIAVFGMILTTIGVYLVVRPAV